MRRYIKNEGLIEKACIKCNTVQPLDRFRKYKTSSGKYYIRSYCKTCDNKLHDKSDKRIGKEGRKRRLRQKYKMTMEQYTEMYNNQKGKCLICNNHFDLLDIDHCHTSGKIRGLLCGNCNRGLGSFKDNTLYLQNAIKYLEYE